MFSGIEFCFNNRYLSRIHTLKETSPPYIDLATRSNKLLIIIIPKGIACHLG